LFGSVCSFTQTPPQREKPALQIVTHIPALQLATAFGSLVVQTVPQAPQLFTSVCSLMQTALPEQITLSGAGTPPTLPQACVDVMGTGGWSL
jgi:hypothetical protein